jgi:hypothetical protein
VLPDLDGIGVDGLPLGLQKGFYFSAYERNTRVLNTRLGRYREYEEMGRAVPRVLRGDG